MEINNQTKLTFHGVDILNVNFNAIAPPEGKGEVNVKCDPKVFYPLDNKCFFKIIMDIELKNDGFFELMLRAVGTFEVESELNDELRGVFVNSNAPAIMFPYIRSFISTLTANLGNVVETLTLPTQFFKGNLEEFKE